MLLHRLSRPSCSWSWLAVLALLGAASACQDRASSRFAQAGSGAAPQAPGPAPAAPAAPGLAGSQDELASALDAAAQTADPAASDEVRRRWQGQRVRWTVTRVPALCGASEACYVQPFASARRSETSAHGWLPELEFAEGQRQRLLSACAAAEVCKVTVEGEIAELRVSQELPTSVRLSKVRVVDATAG